MRIKSFKNKEMRGCIYMSDLGLKIGEIIPEKSALSILGNKVLKTEVFENGLNVERKKGNKQYLFSEITKIIARGYASPTPVFIFIKIFIAGTSKTINFELHPEKKDVNLLLEAYSRYQLGSGFPENLKELQIELRGLGTEIWLRNGNFILGKNEIPIEELEFFEKNRNGFYNFKLKSIKQKLPISPDYAPNILTSIKIMDAILNLNHKL